MNLQNIFLKFFIIFKNWQKINRTRERQKHTDPFRYATLRPISLFWSLFTATCIGQSVHRAQNESEFSVTNSRRL